MKEFLRRHKRMLMIEGICAAICAVLCFQPEKLIFSADSGEVIENIVVDGQEDVYQSDGFRLLPGVYRLRVRSGDHEGMLRLAVSAEGSTFQALRGNEVRLYSGQQETEMEVYVADVVEAAVVNCYFDKGAGQPIEWIGLYRTSAGWRMLVFILLIAGTGLNLLVWLRESLLNARLGKEREVVILGLGFCILLAYLPYATDYFSFGADGAFHALRIEGLKKTLLHGQQFPVRVQEYWMYGHGYAVSSFYGDLFLLFPVLLRLIGFSLMSAYKMFVLAVLAGTAVIAYYAFYQCTRDRYGALLGSMIYELAPYHIYNVYNRNAVGEYLGMMFLPLVVCGFYRIYTEDCRKAEYSRAKIPLMIGLSGILQCHILTCEMTVAALAVAAVVMWKKTFRRETLRELAKAALWCLLLNAWFWVPLLKMMSADSYALGEIVSQEIQSKGTSAAGILQVYPYVGGRQTGIYNCEPIQAGAAFWVMLLCWLVLRLVRRAGREKKRNPYDRVMSCGIFLSILYLFLSTRYFPWDMLAGIPGIGVLVTAVQFPTRFLAMTTLFLAFTASFFVPWMRKEKENWTARDGKIIMAGSFAGIVVVMVWAALFHVNDIAYNMKPVRLYTAENMGTISVVNGEYLLAGTEISEYKYHGPVVDEGLVWGNYRKEGLTIQMDIENPTGEELYAELPMTGYRGYGVESEDAENGPYVTEERGAHGDLRIAIPPGYGGKIKVSYEGFLLFRIAEWISWLTVLALCGIAISRASLRKGGGQLWIKFRKTE